MDETNLARKNLELATFHLLQPRTGKVFYAQFLMRMEVSFTDRVPTAGVSITNKVNFYINPKFFNGLDLYQQAELIEHEVRHITNLHPIRAKKLGEDYTHETHHTYNLATDAHINEDLKNLTRDGLGVTIERLNEIAIKEKCDTRFFPKDASDVNYWKLKGLRDELDDKGALDKYSTVDDHGTWSESTDSEEIAKEVVKQNAKKALEKSGGIGNVPGDVAKMLGELFKNQVNWKQELRRFIARSSRYDFEHTRKRRNRRYGYLLSGRKKDEKLKIAICVDTSGSVSDAAFTAFFNEIYHISKLVPDIYVIEADCRVAKEFKYDPQKHKNIERFGGGGTSYSPAIKRAVELEVDAICYFGDMDAADKPNDPGVPFLWVAVGNSDAPAKFGRLIRIDAKGH